MANNRAPPSALLNDKQHTDPLKSFIPMIVCVCNDTESHILICGLASRLSCPAHCPVATSNLFGCIAKLYKRRGRINDIENDV